MWQILRLVLQVRIYCGCGRYALAAWVAVVADGVTGIVVHIAVNAMIGET